MTRHAEIPSEAHARRTTDHYLDRCRERSQRPSVLALAGQLGLSNTTFRRHFPHLATELSRLRSEPAPSLDAEPNRYERLIARNAKLRHANRALSEQLHLAAAQLQRLAIDNARLRQAVEATSNVTHIDRARGR